MLQACHKHGVMHRDLKPENFLFANKKESSPLKAIDFGLSITFKRGIAACSQLTYENHVIISLCILVLLHLPHLSICTCHETYYTLLFLLD